MSLTVTSWNVNSIKARLPNVLDWLRENKPDVACLQELKCLEENFPAMEIEDLGYNIALAGQKSYNGVALLSRLPIEEVALKALPKLDKDDEDEQARYIEAVVAAGSGPVRIASIYLPNGNPAPGPKFDYKLSWMKRLHAHAAGLLDLEQPVILAGDYNVIPRSVDAHEPEKWLDDALFRPESRDALYAIRWLGYADAFEQADGRAHQYTFWDYQGGAWQRGNGIRIDHLLLSPQAADALTGVEIDKSARGKEKASDHTPITATFEL